MTKSQIKIASWASLLGVAIASFIAAMWADSFGYLSPLVVISLGTGVIGNYFFFFLTLSISACLYILSGIQTGHWSLGLRMSAYIFVASVLVLTCGLIGLAAYILFVPDVARRFEVANNEKSSI